MGATRISSGPKWLQDAINQHADAIEQNVPISGQGITFSDSPSGAGRVGEVDALTMVTAPKVDFSLYDASDSDGAKLGIYNGTVNGQLPSGMTAGGEPAYILDAAESGQAWLVLTASYAGGITSLTIDTGDSMPADTPAIGTGSGTYYRSLGDFGVASGKLTIGSGAVGIGSQTFGLCRQAFSNPVTYLARWGSNQAD